MKQNIGFLGCGNMGGAIVAGMMRSHAVPASRVMVFDTAQEKAQALKKRWKVKQAAALSEVLAFADILLFAVKPQDLENVCAEIRACPRKKWTVVSILAGVPVKKIQRLLGNMTVIRAMPNLGAFVGEGVTAVTAANAAQAKLADTIFSGSGPVISLPEKFFDLVTAVSGSGPAYFFYLMESMVKEAVAQGLPLKQAEILVKQTAKGAAVLALQSSEGLDVLRKKVTSKKGTTEAALKIMDQKQFPLAVRLAVRGALKRARQLGRK